jgi:hypothetical protein
VVVCLWAIPIQALRTQYFDTNVSEHHHFFIEGENDLVDILPSEVIEPFLDEFEVSPAPLRLISSTIATRTVNPKR